MRSFAVCAAQDDTRAAGLRSLRCRAPDVTLAAPRMSQNYKETLNLPKTDFPMKANLATREPEMLKKWQEAGLYEQIQAARADAELFVLHDGPPFANGDVHMGTALNKILKDLVVKSKTMAGFRAPYVPGWDCHGLPIEYKVVKESRGLSPLEVRQKSEAFARKFVDIQREQFKRLGVFGDWEHPYLTLDPAYEAEILRAFAVFVEKGLVYESMKPVFWSTGAQTALAEAEVEYQDREDTAVYVKFPIASGDLAGKASIVIWTTTPWTLPANLAIALHPKELYVAREFRKEGVSETLVLAATLVEAFCAATGFEPTGEPISSFPGSKLEGLTAQHPFLPRTSSILTADFRHDGYRHRRGAHRPGSWRRRLLVRPKASAANSFSRWTITAVTPMKRVCRNSPANMSSMRMPTSSRCCARKGCSSAKQFISIRIRIAGARKRRSSFRAVEQFFIRIDDLRANALAAIKDVRWLPPWGENRISGTVESRPDWVISRQRSWGVPLPVFYSAEDDAILDPKWIRKLADLVAQRGSNVWFELDDAALARELGLPEGTRHRNDTIDVWIDSGVSHAAVLATHPRCAIRPTCISKRPISIAAGSNRRS